MKNKIIFIVFLIIIANQANIYSDQDVNRYYGRYGQDSQRYYGPIERDTPSRSSSCRCKRNDYGDKDIFNDIPQNIVVVKSDSDKDKKHTYRKSKRESRFNKKI